MISLLLLALFAPAPFPRPVPPLPVITPSSVTMTWMGTDCETHFHADGHYACLWAGRWWGGRWSQVGGVLTVTEWPNDRPASRVSWATKLKCPRTGDMGGSPWRVVPLGGPAR